MKDGPSDFDEEKFKEMEKIFGGAINSMQKDPTLNTNAGEMGDFENMFKQFE